MKKFILSALVSASSAHDAFLENDFENFDESLLTGEVDLSTTIGNGVCQAYTSYDLYNLKDWDALERNVAKQQPAALNFTSGTFLWKTCQPNWDLTGSIVSNATTGKVDKTAKVDASCKDLSGQAYLVDSDGKCTYSFGGAEFTGRKDKSFTDFNITKGFELIFTSKEACKDDSTKKFKVEFEAYCMDPDHKTSVGNTRVTPYDETKYGKMTVSTKSTCEQEIAYYGKEACKLSTINVSAAVEFVKKFAGVFMILGGIILAAYGAKIIFYAFSAIIFFVTSAAVFFGVYNMFLTTSTGKGILIGVLVLAMILGGLAAYFMKKFFERFGVPIIAGGGGLVVGLELIGLATENGAAKVGAMLVGAIVGFYLGKKLNKLAKCVTTAIVGSFLFVKGVKCYVQKEDLGKYANWIELGAVIVVALAGSILQLYLLRDENADGEKNDDDFMKGEDEGRTCGCL